MGGAVGGGETHVYFCEESVASVRPVVVVVVPSNFYVCVFLSLKVP